MAKDLLAKARAEKEKLIKGFNNMEKHRIPLESYMNYAGTIGFADYMKKCDVEPKNFTFHKEYMNLCACNSADGKNVNTDAELTEMLEKELKILNNLHRDISNKIYDVHERIANLELDIVNKMPDGEEKKGFLHKIKTKFGNIKAYRESIVKKFEEWKTQAQEREQKRSQGAVKNKTYENADDEQPDDKVKEPEKCKPCIIKAWVKENQPMISLGFMAASVLVAIILLHHVKTNGK